MANKPTAALFLAAAMMVLCAASALAQGTQSASPMANAPNKQQQQQQPLTAAQCREALQSAGGESALLARAPSCSSAATSTAATGGAAAASNAPPPGSLRTQLDACCSELKAAIAADSRIGECVCNSEVWEGAKGRIAEAGLRGVNQNTIEAFAKSCGLKYAGNGC